MSRFFSMAGEVLRQDHTDTIVMALMDPEVQKKTVPSGSVPCRYSSLRDPGILQEFPQYEPVCKALESGVYRPIMENWSEFYTILGTHMRGILSCEVSVEDGLKAAQAELEKL